MPMPVPNASPRMPCPPPPPAPATTKRSSTNSSTSGANGKYRTWSDSTTHAVHEGLTLRAEFVHESDPRDTAWTIAAYESPVGERLWHATATASTPTDVVRTLLDSLASGDAWGAGLDTKVSEKTLAKVTRPFADTGWPQTSDGRCMNWTAPDAGAAGLRFDAFAAQHANGPLPTWTLWGGNTPHQPTWTIHLSTHTPTAILQALTYELAHGESTRELPDPSPHQAMPHATGTPLPGQPVAPPTPTATRIR